MWHDDLRVQLGGCGKAQAECCMHPSSCANLFLPQLRPSVCAACPLLALNLRWPPHGQLFCLNGARSGLSCHCSLPLQSSLGACASVEPACF